MSGDYVAVPQIEGVRCPVQRPVGAIGANDHVGAGAGYHMFPEGPGVVVTLRAEDGTRLAAIMAPEKAKAFSDLLDKAVKRGLRARGRIA